MHTVKRLLRGGDSIRMGCDPNASVLDLEAEQRLFSKRQREVLVDKFGHCVDPGCDRPPSWTEAHHIKYHDEGYEIEVDHNGTYWQIPPVSRDPQQKPVPMPLKSNTITELWRQHRAS